ncbi:MAG: GldG family protein [Deltaproteobacteria bacterium]
MSVIVIILGLAATAVSGISAYLIPDNSLVWQISLGVAVIAYFIYFYQERQFFKELLSKKSTRYGLNAVLVSLIAFGILVLVNLIATKYDLKKDLTKNKLHTLSDESIKVLKNLSGEIKLKAFINPTQMPEFEKIFEKYTYYSSKLKKEYIDVDKDPFVVQRYNIKQAGTILVESETRTSRVENLFGPDDPKLEEKITNAIIQVAKGDKKKIYYVSGHGEKLLSDSSREGYSEMKDQLESGRYKVEELVLVEKGLVPEDADIVILAAPKSDLLDVEIKAIEGYLAKGGKVLLMVEPTSSSSLKGLLARYGAVFNPKKTVVELNPLQQLAGGNPLTPIVTSYNKESEITREAKQISLFPIATPIEKSETQAEGLKVTSLFSTSAKSFESDLKDNQVKPNPKTDRKGPLSLGVSISGKAVAKKPTEDKKEKGQEKTPVEEKKEPEFRMIVVGDSDFASNSGRRFGINADIFQNMLSWLAHEEDLISIRPRATDVSDFEITETRMRSINLASIVFAPLLMFGSGLVVWINRRRK